MAAVEELCYKLVSIWVEGCARCYSVRLRTMPIMCLMTGASRL